MDRLIYYSLLLLMLLPIANAEVFSSLIKVTTENDNTTCLLNVTTEQNLHSYNCLVNSTNSFTFDLQRNISTCDDITPSLDNLSKNIGNMVGTCDAITKQYGDVSSYYKLYASCNADHESCKKDKDANLQKANEMSAFKKNFEECSSSLSTANGRVGNTTMEITNMQNNLESCNLNLNNAGNEKFLWGIIGMAIVAALWVIDRKKMYPSTRKSRMPSGLNR